MIHVFTVPDDSSSERQKWMSKCKFCGRFRIQPARHLNDVDRDIEGERCDERMKYDSDDGK